MSPSSRKSSLRIDCASTSSSAALAVRATTSARSAIGRPRARKPSSRSSRAVRTSASATHCPDRSSWRASAGRAGACAARAGGRACGRSSRAPRARRAGGCRRREGATARAGSSESRAAPGNWRAPPTPPRGRGGRRLRRVAAREVARDDRRRQASGERRLREVLAEPSVHARRARTDRARGRRRRA